MNDRKIVDYMVAEASTPDGLGEEVRRLVQPGLGWQPLGSAFATVQQYAAMPSSSYYCQTLVRYAN